MEIITQYSSKQCVVFLFARVRQGYRWISFEQNSQLSMLQILWIRRCAAQRGPLLSSPLLMRNITSPPIPHQHSRKDDSYCGHLIVGLLGIFCYTWP